ncbi:helix-turn-helix transcriptional regulator [Robertkochia sediminum]|uniref:helix-turn-helix transcriptional regulator n=1 Tax=Robertkochia sediminum TaxID=2785326 RepID=UPI001931D477|nr:helix-turn-helix domain-containing protein [Robertkochia sediminum]MBL7473790.1 helix-turn-helix domain-containing protein [Robertkochia sediminum]
MEEGERIIKLLREIKGLMAQQKKIMTVEELSAYTGLSKSKIYKLTHRKLIPCGNNPHIRQKYFDKDVIDQWLLGHSEILDNHLEDEFFEQLLKRTNNVSITSSKQD